MKTVGIDLSSLDDNFSGIERFALELTKNIIQNNTKNKIFIIFKNKIHPSFLNLQNNLVSFIVKKSKSRIIFLEFLIPKIIKKYKFDYMFFPGFPPSIFLKKSSKTRIISTIHDLVAWDVPKTMTLKSKIYFKISIRRAIKISYKLTVTTNFVSSRLINILNVPKNKIIITPIGTNMMEKLINKSILLKYNINNDFYLTVGTLEPRKNFVQLIDYYSRLPEPKNDLVIVGRLGWNNKDLNQLIINNPKIHYLGFVDDNDLCSLYHFATAFLFFSIYEGFGIPIIESITNHLLPIASNIPTNYEILGDDYPFIFKLNDFDSFEKAVKKLQKTSKEDLNDILNDKISLIFNKYSWQKSATAFLSIINEEYNE